MKLAQLRLDAFGPFTDRILNFEHPSACVHLVVGPNEAGKSSALRAMVDLRFEIPTRSTDDFVHAHKNMRVSGVFVDAQGQRHGLTRRKGRGDTLGSFDPQTGEPLAHTVAAEVRLALQGGLTRDAFEAMYGLDHLRMRAGGLHLLQGRGELGAMLFEASAGMRNVQAVLKGLDDEARLIFNPDARAKRGQINEARLQFAASRDSWRQAMLRPATWQGRQLEHQQADQAVQDAQQRLLALRHAAHALQELRSVAPLLRDLDHTRLMLEQLPRYPNYPQDGRDQRLAALQLQQTSLQALRDAEQSCAAADQALASLVLQPAWLVHADTIDQLIAALPAARQDAEQALHLAAQLERLTADLMQRLADVSMAQVNSTAEPRQARLELQLNELAEVQGVTGGQGSSPAASGLTELAGWLRCVPNVAQQAIVQQAVQQAQLSQQSLLGLRQQQQELRARHDAMVRLGGEAERTADHAARRAALQQAVADAAALGDIDTRLDALAQHLDAAQRHVQQACTELGVASATALRAVQPVLDADLSAAQAAWVQCEQQLAESARDQLRQQQQVLDLLAQRDELLAQGAVVSEASLQQARAHRDQLWLNLLAGGFSAARSEARQALRQELHQEAHQVTYQADAASSLAQQIRDFERAVAQADWQADRLHADATRAALLARLLAQIEAGQAQQQVLRQRHEHLQATLSALQQQGMQRLQAHGWPDAWLLALAPCPAPALVREWQEKRRLALEQAEQMLPLQRQLAQMQASRLAALVALESAWDGGGGAGGVDGVVDRRAAVVAPSERISAEPGWPDFAAKHALDQQRDVSGAALGPVLLRAQTWLRDQVQAEQADQARRQALAALAEQALSVQQQLAQTEQICAAADQAVTPWRQLMRLPAESPPAAVLAQMQALLTLQQTAQQRDVLTAQAQQHVQRAARFEQRVEQVFAAVADPSAYQTATQPGVQSGAQPNQETASLCGSVSNAPAFNLPLPKLASVPLHALAAELHTRLDQLALRFDHARHALAQARSAHQQQAALLQTRQHALTAMQRARADLALAEQRLSALSEAAGACPLAQLPEVESAQQALQQAQAQADQLLRQLREVSDRSLEDLRASLADADVLAMQAQAEALAQQIDSLDAELGVLRQRESQARLALAQIDASDAAAVAREAMESAAATIRQQLMPWAQLRVAHGLLSQALLRFRDHAQAPMVAAASDYFALMTDGRYPRLRVQASDDAATGLAAGLAASGDVAGPGGKGANMLVAERADGTPISIAQMSEGTGDQLYLALRLAALQLRQQTHPMLPLVLDDVLMTSDDQRAAQMLRALARFAEQAQRPSQAGTDQAKTDQASQVILFSHHAHVADLALQTLGPARVAVHQL